MESHYSGRYFGLSSPPVSPARSDAYKKFADMMPAEGLIGEETPELNIIAATILVKLFKNDGNESPTPEK
jgi:hypothetical protein